MFQIPRPGALMHHLILSAMILFFPAANIRAGGGMVLESDLCILWIDFYSMHFTAYQPESSGNKQFCQDLPDTGGTIFVLDYLHQSLKEVPVDFRIIRDVTGQGRFIKLKHVEELENIDQHTVFYQPPVVRADASLKIEYDFREAGSYVGIVSAGHPLEETVYTAVFPFEVGAPRSGFVLPLLLVFAGLVFFFLRHHRRSKPLTSAEGAAS